VGGGKLFTSVQRISDKSEEKAGSRRRKEITRHSLVEEGKKKEGHRNREGKKAV